MYVADLQKSVEFYQRLGFEPVREGSNNRDVAYVRLDGLSLQFVAQSSAADKPEAFQRDAFGEPKGTGLYMNVEVDDVDQFFQTLKADGVTTSSEPRDWPWGQREFVLRDPDGYKLVFYQIIR